MKKIILSLLFIVTTFTVTETKAQYNVVKINPISAGLHTASIAWEHTLNWNTSIQIGTSYTPAIEITSDLFDGDTLELSGNSNTFELRKYTKRNSPKGFYWGPYLRRQTITLKENNLSSSLSVSSVGAMLGGHFLIGGTVSLDMYLGLGLGSYSISTGDTFSDISDIIGAGNITTAAARYGFTVGIAIPTKLPRIGNYF
jgi:hypothetical protein